MKTPRGIGKMGLGMMTVQLAQSKIGYEEDEEIRHADRISGLFGGRVRPRTPETL